MTASVGPSARASVGASAARGVSARFDRVFSKGRGLGPEAVVRQDRDADWLKLTTLGDHIAAVAAQHFPPGGGFLIVKEAADALAGLWQEAMDVPADTFDTPQGRVWLNSLLSVYASDIAPQVAFLSRPDVAKERPSLYSIFDTRMSRPAYASWLWASFGGNPATDALFQNGVGEHLPSLVEAFAEKAVGPDVDADAGPSSTSLARAHWFELLKANPEQHPQTIHAIAAAADARFATEILAAFSDALTPADKAALLAAESVSR